MDSQLFESWFEKVFLQFCGSRRPVLLIFDNHDSHISLPLLKKARENDIHVLGLPPHTTHILQPLDVSIFGPLKEKVASLATTLGFLSTNLLIGKARFSAILSSAIDHVCSPAKIKDGYLKCGMFPVDINAIDRTQVRPVDPQEDKRKQSDESPKDRNASDNSTNVPVLCHTCGTSIDVAVEDVTPVNPLVQYGIIPETLGKILVPPSTNGGQKKKSSKIVTEARVLTGEDMIKMLEETEENARIAQEEKENRKIERIKKREKEKVMEEKREAMEERKMERERRKKEKEEEKGQKNVERNRQRRDNGMNLCILCYEPDPEGGISSNADIMWYQCSVCEGWAQQICTCVQLGEDENYVCDDCFVALEE